MDLFARLDRLYSQLPQVKCTGCGLCCVSPTCMLAEFIYLMHHAQQNLAPEIFKASILAPPQIHSGYDGNLVCSFISGTACGVHRWRTGACRLFGLSDLRLLHIDDMVYCRNNIDRETGNENPQEIEKWLEELVAIDKGLYAYNTEPFFVKGFNVPCWLDIYFDDSFEMDVFAEIRAVMKMHLDLSAYAADYRPRTQLKEKIDKIAILSAMAGQAQMATVISVLKSIRDHYPLTGTYYQDEVVHLLEIMEKPDL